MTRRINIRVILAAICLIAIIGAVAAVDLFTYTQTLTLQSREQLSMSITTASWTVYVNDANVVVYIPGNSSEPTLNTNDPSTYSFNVTTDAYKGCAVEIQVETPAPVAFTQFEVTVLTNSSSTWVPVSLYTTATGATTVSSGYLDGTISGASAYVHQSVSTTAYYIVQVTYTYTADTVTSYSIQLLYTPTAESFT